MKHMENNINEYEDQVFNHNYEKKFIFFYNIALQKKRLNEEIIDQKKSLGNYEKELATLKKNNTENA